MVREGVTRIKFGEHPTYAELEATIEAIVELPYERRLWDFSAIAFDLDMTLVRRIAEFGKSKLTRPSLIAVVAPQDLAYGELRAFAVYRETSRDRIRVFRTVEEAEAWFETVDPVPGR